MINIVFYSHFGNGDIFNSKEFIREIVELNQFNCYYAHAKNPRIIADIPIEKVPIQDEYMNPMLPFRATQDTVYINTWIGRHSRYVLPGIGCVIENYKKMLNNEFQLALRFQPFTREIKEYIPDIDYSYFHIDGIYDKINLNKTNVLISNGSVGSNQAENFSFTPVLESLAKLKEISFYVTDYDQVSSDNIYYIPDIINTSDDSNLNEISFLSTFMDFIIGRSSGPYVFCQTKENLFNDQKTFLSFAYHPNVTRISSTVDFSAKIYWSPEILPEKVYKVIEETINA